jgi:hypothetical protein
VGQLSSSAGIDKANYLLDSIQLGRSNPDDKICQVTYNKCPEEIWNKAMLVSSVMELPTTLWKMGEDYFFPYHWFRKMSQCSLNENNNLEKVGGEYQAQFRQM